DSRLEERRVHWARLLSAADARHALEAGGEGARGQRSAQHSSNCDTLSTVHSTLTEHLRGITAPGVFRACPSSRTLRTAPIVAPASLLKMARVKAPAVDKCRLWSAGRSAGGWHAAFGGHGLM